ncbi:hypothetical protein M9Y10_035530 [Tritrichomonas musculus]|uniref:Uncharacterized protein n=1 Tax=Tritrichomonas musculus TaxID=1915356 RepID=A0ABR2KHW2_9EUKA
MKKETNVYIVLFSLFKIKKSIVFTYKQCIDLLKISDFLQVRKLTKKLNQYIKKNGSNADFIIQIIHFEVEKQEYNNENEDYYQFTINQQMEYLLSEKINDCFQNVKFADLPLSLIYRVVEKSEKSEKSQMSNDMLYDFIKKSITKFCPLFYFLNIQKLSEERLLELCESFANSDETSRKLFEYLKCNLEFVMLLVKDKGNLQRKISDLENEKSQIQDNLTKAEREKNQIQDKLNKVETEKSQIQDKLNKVETEKTKLTELFEQTKNAKSDLETENSSLKKQLSDIEDEMSRISGTITARVKSSLLFSAQIKLQEKKSPLDKSKSKYIVSTSNAKMLGEAAYKRGQPITSLDQETICFGGKAGTYYVRALVFSEEGKATEIVSNPVTTSGSSIAFGYEGKAVQVTLIDGKYKLEVWGAQGGDGGGTRQPQVLAKVVSAVIQSEA